MSAATSRVSRVTLPRYPDSVSDVTNANEPSGDDRLPPPWLIVIGIVGGLTLVFLLGAGVGQR